ncbi:PAS domain-containing hybrid sensor histidine kinase/response regulator [Marinobacterium sediminicola]|uniref:histidine kinase n=1 Tax=Marinobacterium sediminicola TaxID=518898 RepID=A0ABY1RXQ6_9GAMM|nr:NahK/ErcS family hybrid sensor histidine kinase/response regulator [Marinobacterium sediminicola]ULG67757.1 ATP-binding protein [Marinobacterium sediminicola]SMR71596.1 PAS domain S-box-containing protein [Marinobacterium sediminicola]
MKKPSENSELTVEHLIGLGGQSARKSYYPELLSKIEELESERNRYKWLFDNALHGIFQADLTGRVGKANRAMARICGFPDHESMVQGVNFATDLLFSEQEFRLMMARLVNDGQLFLYETRMRKACGEAIEVSMNILLRRKGDEPDIVAFVADITERKKVQQRMLSLNEELEQRVEERTRELVQLNDRLWREVRTRQQAEQEMLQAKEAAEAANLSKDKYLAAASHDLLQPMNAARLLVAALQERNLPAAEADLVDRVHVALDGAEHLLTDLLEISKLDQNAVQPELQSFPVSRLAETLRAEFEPVAEAAELSFAVHCGSDWVASDLRLLTRILRNFLSNAFRYTDQGGVLLGFRRRGDRMSIQVWDTGGGIPDDKQEAIFQEFCRLSQHHSKKVGVGLGLAIVERIARMLDHPISLRSVVGAGSCFEVSIPLAAATYQVPSSQAAQPVVNTDLLEGRKVLVLDNDPAILISMQALLGGWGCDVLLAHNLSEAKEACAENPDLVLADYHLEDHDTGLELRAWLNDSGFESVPMVMLTADRSDETRKAFRAQGVQVLNKPVKPGKLRALMTHLTAEKSV